ncbi:MAG: hypothetical protein ABSH05_09655 [Bryobacteraceae bacterium]|jgi:hypothetical protein
MAKVFISCGQRKKAERDTAEATRKLLSQELGLDCYVATETQSLNSVLNIFNELEASDYYVFIDFLRQGCKPFSLFTHQELAVACRSRFLDHEIIVLQQKGLKSDGVLKYMQSNPAKFKNSQEVVGMVRHLAREKKWNSGYSTHLRVELVAASDWVPYMDHRGTACERIRKARIQNRRGDVAAERATCVLHWLVTPKGQELSEDRTCLKWATQVWGYDRTIPPYDWAEVDLFAERYHTPGVFLHSQWDVGERKPIAEAPGAYELHYRLYAQGFPLCRFKVSVELDREGQVTGQPSVQCPDLDVFEEP